MILDEDLFEDQFPCPSWHLSLESSLAKTNNNGPKAFLIQRLVKCDEFPAFKNPLILSLWRVCSHESTMSSWIFFVCRAFYRSLSWKNTRLQSSPKPLLMTKKGTSIHMGFLLTIKNIKNKKTCVKICHNQTYHYIFLKIEISHHLLGLPRRIAASDFGTFSRLSKAMTKESYACLRVPFLSRLVCVGFQNWIDITKFYRCGWLQ